MIGRLSLLALAASFPFASALAQVVDIRSGEHADFTRLVLYLGEAREWEFGRTEQGYGLRIDDDLQFDRTRIFDFIPRSRLTDVRSAEAGLNFLMECDCHAIAFEFRPDILVLDFKDGPAPRNGRYERLLEATAPPSIEVGTDNDAEVTSTDRAGRLQNRNGQVAPPSLKRTQNMNGLDIDQDFLFARAVPEESVVALSGEVREGLGRAIAFGMLDPSETSKNISDSSIADDGGPSVTVRSGMVSEPGAAENPPGANCAPSALFDVAAWGGDLPVTSVVPAARSKFLQAGDDPTDEATLDLARAFLFLGFGAEARESLRTYPVRGLAHEVTMALAAQIDQLDNRGPDILTDQIACDGPGALWALIALGKSPQSVTAPNLDSIYQTLSKMPIHLRAYLAPVVSSRLRALGYDDEAVASRNAVSRARPSPDPAMILETALAVPDAGHSDLEAMARGTSALAVPAQAEVLRRLAASSQTVPTQMREEIEARLHETKGSDTSVELAAAYFDALSRSGAHEHALNVNRRLAQSGFAAGPELDDQAGEILASLAEDGSDGSLLVVARRVAGDPLVHRIPPDVADAMAARLLALGFDSLAEPFAAGGADTLGLARRQFLAQRALDEERPAEVVALLAANRDEVSLRLKAMALMNMAAFSEAAGVYMELGDEDLAAEAYWRAGRWDAAASLLPEGERRAMAERLSATGMQSDAPAASASDQGLADPAGLVLPGSDSAIAPVTSTAGGATPALVDDAPRILQSPARPGLSETETLINESRDLRLLAEELLAGDDPGT